MIGRFVSSACCLLGLAACSSYSVVRVVDGQEIPGRFVSHQAYTEYARGALLEARGDLEAASSAYGRALASDARSVELWTRLGALRCRLKRGDAEQAFRRAAELDEEYAPLWRERAQCHLLSGKRDDALAAALRAAELDPNQPATTLLVASLYERRNQLSGAWRWLDALVLRQPTSVVVQQAKLDLAVRHSDTARARQAADVLRRLRDEAPHSDALEAELRQSIGAALAEEDLPKARDLARRLLMPPGELALVAVTLGKPQLALVQAEWVLRAAPDDGDAWVAALCAADLLQNSQRFVQFLRLAPSGPVALGPLGAQLFTELLRRKVGDDAARAWLAGNGPSGAAKHETSK